MLKGSIRGEWGMTPRMNSCRLMSLRQNIGKRRRRRGLIQ